MGKNESILKRWSEHCHTLFNACHTVQQSAIDRIPQQPVKAKLGKSPNLAFTALNTKLHEFFVSCWEQGKPPPYDRRNGVIITLYKNKGEHSEFSKYRGKPFSQSRRQNRSKNIAEHACTHEPTAGPLTCCLP